MNKWFQKLNSPLAVVLMLTSLSLLGVWVVLTFNGNGDTGDSIVHFQFARYAFEHPENFLNSWAKPVYVILASPFAQFGFEGIKIFNLVIAIATAFLLYLLLKSTENPFSFLAIPLLFAAPLYFVLIFSGLTEYMFALIWVLGVWLFTKEKYVMGAILLSFLPFARSEGLLLLPCVFMFMLIQKKWKALPWLLTATFVFGIIGLLVSGDFFSTTATNPYISFRAEYGKGPWLHFLSQLTYVIGIPMYFLFGVSLVILVFGLFKSYSIKNVNINVKLWLFILPIIIFIGAHTCFYALGFYHSMGLKRVLICIVPMIVYLIVDCLGYLWLHTEKTSGWIKFSLLVLVVGAVLVFPFTAGPAAIKKKELMCDNLQITTDRFADALQKRYLLSSINRIYCSQPYLQLKLNIDPFDTQRISGVGQFPSVISDTSFLLIWDCEFSEYEAGLHPESLLNRSDIRLDLRFPEDSGDPCFLVFAKKM